jgi:Transposase DNA-binding
VTNLTITHKSSGNIRVAVWSTGRKMCTGVVSSSGNGITGSDQEASTAWSEQEWLGGQFGDVRLKKRSRTLLEQLSTGVGESIPLICQDWANTKTAYRFFSNERVSKVAMLAGHLLEAPLRES